MSNSVSAKPNIVFMMTGSIACFKACSLISLLTKSGSNVRTVVSPSALRFIGDSTLEGLTGFPVFKDMYSPSQQMDHISLARWADLLIVCPASANSINKMAAGIADDAVTTLALANNFKKPLLIAPAMNTEMFLHPATQASLKKLKEWGAAVVESPNGQLACGEVGEGRLIEPENLFEIIRKVLKI